MPISFLESYQIFEVAYKKRPIQGLLSAQSQAFTLCK
jgi:hypothetical protein